MLDGARLISLERRGASTYGEYHNPAYNILSYTWGRWEIPDGEALPVENVTWKIPSIHPSAFTVDEFWQVLQSVSNGCHFIWLDVACIDQEDEITKMSEIGHQAAIFRGAQQAYIWLYATPQEALWEYLVGNHGASLYSDEWLEQRLRCLGHVFHDPWFSSTWTLQEAFLRTQATLVMRDASIVETPDNNQATKECRLVDILSACYTNNQALQLEMAHCAHMLSSGRVALVQRMLETIRNVGALCLYENNAIALYATSTNRTSRDPNDRVYGIMQVFGFALGKSRSSHQDFTLDQLEDQLGASINQSSPTIAQMFTHAGENRPLRSWCMHPGIQIPTRVYNIRKPVDLCRISFDPAETFAKFKGVAARFEPWLAFCRPRIANQRADIEGRYPWIQLDRTSENTALFPEMVGTDMRLWRGAPETSFESLGHGPDVCVLTIGKWEDFEWGETVNKYAGILCREVRNGDHTYWVRFGICMWKMYSHEERLPEHQVLFSSCHLDLG